MLFRHAFEDPENIDLEYPAGLSDLSISSGGSKLFGVMYTPQGKGPHPTILLLHGFPGSERNFDLAQIFRRAGFNVVVFHYRGSWGSEGNFSFSNVLNDTKTVIRYLLKTENAKKYDIDTSRFILMGHSMGGFSTLLTASRLPEINKAVAIAAYNLGAVAKNRRDSKLNKSYIRETHEMFLECSTPLKGTGPEVLLKEIEDHADEWDLCTSAAKLKGKDLMIIAGSRDTISHPDIHHYPFMKALTAAGIEDAKEIIFDASHSLHCKRVALAKNILEWTESKLNF